MKPDVSILVLAYNSASTIEETLLSCYGQSHSNIEVIVADDGSTDDTLAVASALAGKHPRFPTIFVANPVNRGIVANCRSGLAVASGTWVKMLGADDVLCPWAVAQLAAAGEAAEADVVISQFKSFGAEERLYPLPSTVRGIRSRDLAHSMLLGFGAIAPGVLVRLESVHKEDLPSPEYVMAEDSMFYALARRGYRFTFLEEVTVRYRVHPQQVTSGESAAAKLLRADQDRFFRMEVSRRLAPWHPYLLHLRYQRFINRHCQRLPRPIRSVLSLADPAVLMQRFIDHDLPWQRRKSS